MIDIGLYGCVSADALLLGKELLPGLGYCVAVGLHLVGIVLLEPLVFLYQVVDEEDGVLDCYLNGMFACFGVVEPGLGEPLYAKTVRVDAGNTWNVKGLDVDV